MRNLPTRLQGALFINVWCMNASVNKAIIGTYNGLPPVRWKAINWTTENIFQWNLNQNTVTFMQEDVFENVVCEIAAILSRPQYLKRYDVHNQISRRPRAMRLCINSIIYFPNSRYHSLATQPWSVGRSEWRVLNKFTCFNLDVSVWAYNSNCVENHIYHCQIWHL